MCTKTARAQGKVRAQYRWAYATSTLLPLQEIGQNQHEKGGWAYNTSWAYNTYSTVPSLYAGFPQCGSSSDTAWSAKRCQPPSASAWCS